MYAANARKIFPEKIEKRQCVGFPAPPHHKLATTLVDNNNRIIEIQNALCRDSHVSMVPAPLSPIPLSAPTTPLTVRILLFCRRRTTFRGFLPRATSAGTTTLCRRLL